MNVDTMNRRTSLYALMAAYTPTPAPLPPALRRKRLEEKPKFAKMGDARLSVTKIKQVNWGG